MSALKVQADPLTGQIIRCAIAVHRELGPGLLETTYEAAMAIELEPEGLDFQRQALYPVNYRDRKIGE